MKALISVDMEGVAGIATRGQVTPGKPDYSVGRALMTAETNAAIAGAFDAGVEAVLVNDSHGPMDNLVGEDLDCRADYVVGSPKPLSMVQGVEQDTGVVLFVGYHAGPQDALGVLAHTYSGAAFSDLRLNGSTVSEMELNALLVASFGVPVGLVTGDDVTCALAEKVFPGVVTVPVKTAIGLTAARSLHPHAAREAIRAGAAAAVAAAQQGAVKATPLPQRLVIEAELRPNGVAELCAKVPGTERISARVVRREVRDPQEMLDVVVVWAQLSAAYLAQA